MEALTNISDWLFDLSKPVYMLHPNFKFWECSITNKTLTFKVGKLRDGT